MLVVMIGVHVLVGSGGQRHVLLLHLGQGKAIEQWGDQRRGIAQEHGQHGDWRVRTKAPSSAHGQHVEGHLVEGPAKKWGKP